MRKCGDPSRGNHLQASADLFKLICAHNLPTRNEQPSAAIAFGVLIDWISIFCRPRTFELQRSGDVIKTDVKFRRKSEPKKTNSNWIYGGIRNFWHSLLASSPTLFTLPSLLTGGWLIIIGPIPVLALADSSLVPRRFRSFTSISLWVLIVCLPSFSSCVLFLLIPSVSGASLLDKYFWCFCTCAVSAGYKSGKVRVYPSSSIYQAEEKWMDGSSRKIQRGNIYGRRRAGWRPRCFQIDGACIFRGGRWSSSGPNRTFDGMDFGHIAIAGTSIDLRQTQQMLSGAYYRYFWEFWVQRKKGRKKETGVDYRATNRRADLIMSGTSANHNHHNQVRNFVLWLVVLSRLHRDWPVRNFLDRISRHLPLSVVVPSAATLLWIGPPLGDGREMGDGATTFLFFSPSYSILKVFSSGPWRMEFAHSTHSTRLYFHSGSNCISS